MNHKIVDIDKRHPKAEGRIVAHQRYLKGYGPKPHDLTGTIVANHRTKMKFKWGYFIVDFGEGIRESVFGEDLEAAAHKSACK